MRTFAAALLALLFVPVLPAGAQTMAALQGRVVDASGAGLPGASIALRDPGTGLTSVVTSDGQGRYYLAAIPAGSYQVSVEADGFRPMRIEALTFEVGRTLVRDFELPVDTQREAIVGQAEVPLLDRATSTVGHVVSAQSVQQMPLHGRHLASLRPLVHGSVTRSET